MKTKIKTYKEYDEQELLSQSKLMKQMQQQGIYPLSFSMPILLQLELTSRCNVKCKHCYNNSGVINTDKMTIEKWKEFSHYIVNHGGIFECIISGGEPLLLGDDLFDIMDIYHNDGTMFLLITNGLLLDEYRVKRLSKYHYKWIQVSIDGSDPEYHDAFRQHKGSWEKAVKGAYLVSKAGLPLTIAHSVSPFNLNKVDEMCKLAFELGAGSIIMGEIEESGRAYQNKEFLLNESQKEELYYLVEKNAKKYKGKMSIQRSADTQMQLKKYQTYPNNGVIIRPDGNVRMDCMTPFVLGNVLEEDFETIWKKRGIDCWKHPKVNDFIENFENTEIRNYVDNDIIIKETIE